MTALIVLATLLLSSPKRAVSVSGQVFVVTQGGENVKLGLVSLHFIPEHEARKALPALIDAETRRWWSLSGTLAKTTIDLDLANVDLLAATSAEQRYSEESASSSGHGPNPALESARKRVRSKQSDIDTYRSRENQLRTELEQVAAGMTFVRQVPDGLKTAKSDADGRFTTKLPRGTYLVAATADRLVGTHRELYAWSFWVKVTPKSSDDQLFLSNDNLFSSGCSDCAVPPYEKSDPPSESTER